MEESDIRSTEIPRGEWTAQDITEAGWDLGEYRKVLRRLTRKLARMAILDNFDRAQIPENQDEQNLPRQMTLDEMPEMIDSDDEDDGETHRSKADDGEDFDGEEFIADVENYICYRKPIFDKCLAYIQKGMPVSLLDIYELVQDAKRQRMDLRSAQEELDQSQQSLKLARQQFAFEEVEFAQLATQRIEQSLAQREHDLLFVEKNMALEELRFKNRQLDVQISKSTDGVGSGASREIQLITMTSEEAFVVHGAFEFRQWVKLMVEIKEWPGRWDNVRIQRQFTEKVKKEVIASPQHIRSS